MAVGTAHTAQDGDSHRLSWAARWQPWTAAVAKGIHCYAYTAQDGDSRRPSWAARWQPWAAAVAKGIR